ncbi:MAG TPA: glycosyltransferase family 2 protein [Acidimicrobiales bacterium]|nr:glycosyltransferase family 2 protein [Acidimicrobiales bacterium]
MSGPPASRVGCVIVDFNAGDYLVDAVASVRAAGVVDLVVVDNAGGGASRAALGEAADVTIVEPGRNLGFGPGANRGVAALANPEVVLIANADVVLHEGALASMLRTLDEHPAWGIVGPTILTEQGDRYPSVRRFPSIPDAVGHAVLGRVWPANPFTRRYREQGAASDGTAQWVSGSCFVVRRELFELLGGFDERYFMFAEDMDLCWRARALGASVGTCPDAVVTHVEGVSRRIAPYRMQVAHHRSALRFAVATTRGPSRALLPLAAIVLGARLCVALAMTRARAR